MNKYYPISAVNKEKANGRYKLKIDEESLMVMKAFFASLKATGESFFLADQIQRHLEAFLSTHEGIENSVIQAVHRIFRGSQEIILDADYAYALLRPRVGAKVLVRLHPQSERIEFVSIEEYLEVKDAFIQGHEKAMLRGLILDFSPFFQNFPRIREASEMGEGISFLNRQLSGQMYQNPEVFRSALLKFLQDCKLDGLSILVNDHLTSNEMLVENLDAVRALLREHSDDTPYCDLAHDLRVLGFEAGWGRGCREMRESFSHLARLVESPDANRFERFLALIPLVKTVLMVSPHGWFAQDNVLGKPDTGGQVTYVLDQTRALERAMKRQFERCGIETNPRIVILTRLIPNAENTTCNLTTEPVHGTENCQIVRVPFRDHTKEIVPDWISRFKIWPYLEGFAEESEAIICNELGGKPDLIIGHYSDGNLVAYRMAEDLGRTHCAAVHALEKTKYILSDLYWGDMEHDYHFSMQFTADLLAYNSADFIISSSYREIGGTDDEMGMFESYETFSMPGLYRVVSGMDPQLARHNIVPPGASEEYFYPNTSTERRVEAVTEHLNEKFFQVEPGPDAFGRLNNPDLPPIFAMARIDRIKNLAGLIELFGKSPELHSASNLLIVSSLIDADQSEDQEEIEEIHKMYELIEKYNLDGRIRWSAARLNKVETGEIYRIVADRRGVFAQPALMETFGLTVVEAMACALPVVVTCFGGPSEIVVSGDCGEVVNPNDHTAYADALLKVVQEKSIWDKYAKAGVERAEQNFSWNTHATRILELTNVYSYWNYLDVMNRQALDQYIHTLYHSVYRPRTQAMLEE